MKEKELWISIGVAVVTIAIAGGYFISLITAAAPPHYAQETAAEQTATLAVENILDERAYSFTEGETLLSLMEHIDEDGVLALELKTYEGLGTLVSGMGGMKNGTQSKYWQYFVNGEMPQIGVDAYKLKNGDRIEWRFVGESI